MLNQNFIIDKQKNRIDAKKLFMKISRTDLFQCKTLAVNSVAKGVATPVLKSKNRSNSQVRLEKAKPKKNAAKNEADPCSDKNNPIGLLSRSQCELTK